VPAEDQAAAAQIRLKVEINTAEREAHDAPQAIPFRVDNPWFAGEADVATFSREEMLATKLRALLQRSKGRDLFDLAHGLDVFDGLNAGRVVACFGQYLESSGIRISRAEAEQRMFAKLNNPGFLADMRPPARGVGSRAADRGRDQGRICKGLLQVCRTTAGRPVGVFR
jgi:hypothetical protein